MKDGCNPFRVDVAMVPDHPRVARRLATLGWLLQSRWDWAEIKELETQSGRDWAG